MLTSLRRRAAARGGVFTVADAEACGFTRSRRRQLLGTGSWHELRRGVYAERVVVQFCGADAVRCHCLRTAAALAARPGAAASEHSAAALHGLELLAQPPSTPSITKPPSAGHGSKRRSDLRLLPATLPVEHVTVVFGLRATSPARTVVDLARKSDARAAVVVADSVLRRGTTKAQLRSVLHACWGWPGYRRAEAVIAFADGRAESPLESVGRVAMREQHLPPPLIQPWVGEWEAEFRVDYLFEAQRTVGEADGAVKYRTRDDLLREKRREDRLRDLGFEVVRFDGSDLAGDAAELARRFRRAFARAAPGPGLVVPAPAWWRPGQRVFPEPPWPVALSDVAWWLRDPADLRLWDDGEVAS